MVTIPTHFTAHLVTREQLTATVLRLVFDTTQPLDYEPGQYASWLIGSQRRPMSFAAPPNGTRVEFLVDVSPGGLASQFSQQLTQGAQLAFLAPYGQFVIDRADKRPRLFVATGTGIAPIRAQLFADTSTQQTRLVFGTQSAQQRFLDHEFKALADRRPNFTFEPVCRNPDANWSGTIGHAAEVAINGIDGVRNCAIYICGSPEFVTEATQAFIRQGLPSEQLHTEQYT